LALQLASKTGFAPGQNIVIDKGTPYEEVNFITRVSAEMNLISVETPLMFQHGVGATVEVV
jgi:hypothetical protein